MAYIRPIVLVYQEYANLSIPTTTAALPACIIGPCYHIIDSTDNEMLSYVGKYTKDGIHLQSFPNNKPGAIVDVSSVVLKFTEAVISVNDNEIVVDSIVLNKLVFSNMPEELQIGDLVDIYDEDVLVKEKCKITQIDTATNTVYLNKNIVGTYALPNIKVYRKIEDIFITSEDSRLSVNVVNGTFDLMPITVSVNGVNKVLQSAEIFVYYKALRTDLGASLTPIYNANDITALLGKVNVENPLAFGCNVALSNSNTVIYAIAVNSDDLAGYNAAKDILENSTGIYSIVPLTQDIGILTMFKEHCVQNSTPEVGKWRIALGTTPLVTEKIMEQGNGKLLQDTTNILSIVYDENAFFISSGVSQGDFLMLNGRKYTVKSIISEDMVQVTTALDGVANAVYPYQIIREMSKVDQARNIAATSASFNERRFVHIWPDIAIIDGQEVKGYYLACAVAGAIAGLPPHQGFTNMSLAGITAVKHSGDYFNKEQIDIIAEGGTFVFIQDTISSAPRVLQQLTTDMSTIEFRELSFVKNFDYICYMSKDVLDEFIGTYNITPETLTTLATAMRATLRSLTLSSLPKIGAPLLGFEIISVNQLNDIRDRVEMYVNLNLPYALNTIGLHLVSQ